MSTQTRLLVAVVLAVSFTFAGWSLAQNTPEAVVVTFLEHIKEKRTEDAVKLFTDDLRTEFSEPKLREFFRECETARIRLADSRTEAGTLQSIDPPQKRELPRGVIWESVLRFQNATLSIRVALNEQNQIAAVEFYEPSEGWHTQGVYGGSVFARIFEHDHTLHIEVLDPDGQPLQPSNYWNAHEHLYRQMDAIPEGDNLDSRYWTDPTDGTHWMLRPSRSNYAQWSEYGWKENILRLPALEKGTYRLMLPLANSRQPEHPKGNIVTPPITLDETNKEQTITAKMIRGGMIRVRIVDADTGESIERAFAGIVNKSMPSSNVWAWATWDKIGDVIVHDFSFPGRYVITPVFHITQADDLVYTPMEEYEFTLADGDDVEIVAKLRGRPHTQEELDARWQHSIAGTVRDEAGNPLSHAKITLWGTGYRPSSTTTTADAKGNFLLRFSPQELDMWNSGGEAPTPEKPFHKNIRIEVERSGYVWKGVRTADGQFISEPFFSKNEQRGEVSRADWFSLTCFEPEPSESVKQARKLRPATNVYPYQPLLLDLVMQPSVHIRGTILFDEPPEEATPGNRRAAWQPTAQLIFDMPRAETASWQPIFTGRINEDFCFEIDALPQEIDVFLTAGTRQPASWKQDTVVAQTDFFPLPPAGTYDAVLKWETSERQGTRLRRLIIDSLTDSDGNDVSSVYTKSSVPIDYLFNRWTLRGTVRDDLGQPIEGAEVRFYRHDGWKPREREKVTTNSDGMYEVEMKPGNRYPYQDKLHGAEGGEFYIVRVSKEGFLQKHLETDIAVFLSDADSVPCVEGAKQDSFSFKTYRTDIIVAAHTSRTLDLALDRTAEVNVLLLDDAGQPLGGYTMALLYDLEIDSDLRKESKLDSGYARTDREGKLTMRKSLLRVPGWFWLQDEAGENEILRTNNLTFVPGAAYHVGSRLLKDDAGNRRLVLDTVTDADGNDVTSQIVSEDTRTKPLLSGEPETQGRETIDRMIRAITPMLRTTKCDVATLTYTFHLGGTPTEIEVSPYSGSMFSAERIGITRSGLLNTVADSTRSVRFRAIEENGDEIQLYTNLTGRYGVGNGISGSWLGYSSGRFSEAQIVLDAKTFLPKRITADGFEEEYHDFVPLGNGFVPLRITSKVGGMAFDFRFKIHEPGIWLFDYAVRDGAVYDDAIVCRIDNVQVELEKRAPPEQEENVREALRKMSTAGEYWFQWYPKDLPEFSYTFHQEGAEPRVLSWQEIKGADNWYAEFYRKGISYIGVSRLLLIDIDGLHCASVSEDTESGLLTFEFELSQEWMNAVGNGISGSWNGWFNGGIGKGTAVIDTKTATLVEVRTKTYDERYSDYFEVKPGKFVPRRIVIDCHEGNRDGELEMFFDFRFKVYEPCLWLFDRSIVEGKEPSVWISDVLVDGKPGIEMTVPR